jgi:ADP-heptose:LPS heptosyltransferase
MPEGGLGDELGVTPIVREVRRRIPDERITLEGFKRMEIWEHNAHLAGGTEDRGQVFSLSNRIHTSEASIPRKFAKQMNLTLQDDTPEIHLTEAEKARGWNVNGWSRTISIDTWSNDVSRRWPLGRFQRLADLLKQNGWTVFEVGRHRGPPLERIRGSALNQMTIRETAAFIRRTTLYVGNDSGLFHLAAAVGTPQVAIFSISPWRFRSYWNTTALGGPNGCGCARVCARPTQEGPACLTEISVEQVLEAVRLAAGRFCGS